MTELRLMTQIPHYMHALQAAKAAFEQANPGVTVTIQHAVDRFEMNQALDSDEAPDIMEVGGFPIGNADGEFIDHSPFAAEVEGLEADWYSGLRQAIHYGGILPALPLEIMPPLIAYNREMFDRAGLPYPTDDWTWDEMVAIAKQLTLRNAEGRTTQYGFGIGIDVEWWEPFVMRNGGSYVSPNGSTAHGFVDSTATVEAFQKLIDAYRVHKIIRMPNDSSDMAGLEPEDAAMSLMFGWHLLHTPGSQSKYGVVGLPAMPGGIETNTIYMAGIGITPKSQHPRLAWAFLRQYILESRCWVLPNTRSQAVEQGLTDHPIWSRYLQELEHVELNAFFRSKKWNAGRQLINDDIRRMIVDGADVAQTVRSWTRFG